MPMPVDPARPGILEGHIAANVSCPTCGFTIDIVNALYTDDARARASEHHHQAKPTCAQDPETFEVEITTDNRVSPKRVMVPRPNISR